VTADLGTTISDVLPTGGGFRMWCQATSKDFFKDLYQHHLRSCNRIVVTLLDKMGIGTALLPNGHWRCTHCNNRLALTDATFLHHTTRCVH